MGVAPKDLCKQVHFPISIFPPLPLVEGGLKGRFQLLRTIIKNRI
ncbi:rCG63048 [Rattus norvegicus]|uniref:RCG63048 n=1 Tax=Rattus norvegicus TaxID=10116 RepID=A6HVK6_RAT|nr:rCG63048 [Rattus norvegicus]